jgi:ferredoxin
MNTIFYYFSGTGNSLHVVKKLQEQISGAELIPMAQLVNKKLVKPEAKTVGFIFPIYLTAMPVFIKKIISKMDLSQADYIFAVATRIGTQHSAFYSLEKILRKKSKTLNASFTINMPSNDPKFGFRELTEDEFHKIEMAADEKINIIVQALKNKENIREKDVSFSSKVPFVKALSVLVDMTDGLGVNFYADEKCMGCGTCEKVCPSKTIIMQNGKPIWQREIKCFKCNACLNYCPQKAVQIKGFTENKGRYSHPYASADEIMNCSERIQ